MRTHSTRGPMLAVVLATALLLLVPAVATQFAIGFAWSPFDFAVVGVLLSGAGLAFVLVTGSSGRGAYRLALALTLGSTLFLAWVILALGVIGDSGDAADLMYLAVLAAGAAGAAMARLQPRGMARTLLAMAVAQVIVTAAAFLGDMVPAYNTAYEVVGLNAIFVTLFLVAGQLFRAAARPNAPRVAARA